MIKNLFVITFLLLGLSSCQVSKSNLSSTSDCDSINLKLSLNWKFDKYSYSTNREFVKNIIYFKDCFIKKDTSFVVKILGNVYDYKKFQNDKFALTYFATFNNNNAANLIFIVGKDKLIEDIDIIYIDAGNPVK